MVKSPKEPGKPKGSGGSVRLKPSQMQAFKRLAENWKWSDTDLGSRLVDFLDSLDTDAQQLVLGLPMDEPASKVAADKIVRSLVAQRRARDS